MTALGLRVKSGHAIAVVLRGPVESPVSIGRHVVELCDPDVAETRQPYHAGMGRAEEDSRTIAKRIKIIERAAAASVSKLAATLGECRGALVVGSVIEPESVANPHIRAHANEGRLFRTVLDHALAAHGIRTFVIVEKELAETARRLLRASDREVERRMTELGKVLGKPWRSDEKAAATAAWIALAEYNLPS